MNAPLNGDLLNAQKEQKVRYGLSKQVKLGIVFCIHAETTHEKCHPMRKIASEKSTVN